MNSEHEDEDWIDRATALLDSSADNLDAATLSRLNRARQAALAQRRVMRASMGLVGAGLAGAAVALFARCARPAPAIRRARRIAPAVVALQAGDIDFLTSDDDALDLYENLDFYAWLEKQAGRSAWLSACARGQMRERAALCVLRLVAHPARHFPDRRAVRLRGDARRRTRAPPNAAAAPAATPWSALTRSEQQLLAPVRDQWQQLPPLQQQRLRRNAERWQSLTPEQQQRIHQRLDAVRRDDARAARAGAAAIPGVPAIAAGRKAAHARSRSAASARCRRKSGACCASSSRAARHHRRTRMFAAGA